ncbi:AI-2E family transporter [Aureimonas fodinaquatilis]|uniref:AI-2E family transporter n=1 Tax=Aureimonas fodinaquatilis TaxID=2565783 RepID=A0A5B0DZL1_9HYPH|nr:AI-2E family transporter [Aureimonas fodinaquatilis]KAA0971191.1 AI-2E family transporter [Aureimonas fodinaquatilis]
MSETIQRRAFILLLAIVTLAFLWLIRPYYGAVLWAVVLAVIFSPMHRYFVRTMGGRVNLAAIASVFACILFAIVPMAFLTASIVREGQALYRRLSREGFDPGAAISQIHQMLPTEVQGWLDGLGAESLSSQITSAFGQLGQLLAGRAWSFGQGTLSFMVGVGLMIYILFFLFRDGPKIMNVLRRAAPFRADHTEQLIRRFHSVVRATVRGNFVIAALQGTIGGLTLWALGVNAAILWGTIMAVLSLLPAVGAAIVWMPVAINFFLTGDYLKGVILIAVGVAVIGLVDNLLRPPLVGKETRMPDYLVLLSTVGGITLFGINGFVVGPLIAALFLTVWGIFVAERQATEHTAIVTDTRQARRSST